MADGTAIEWTDATWNVVNGCTVHSAGCTNCYAMKQAHRVEARRGLTRKTNGGMVWTGEVRFNEGVLTQPLRWKRPRRIFVCAHGDLFHESVPDEWIDRVFAVMGSAPQHQYQVLTKRSARMRSYLTARQACEALQPPIGDGTLGWHPFNRDLLPPANIWLGVSVEHQRAADERIPDLLATPAEVRWLSCEPLLGAIDLTIYQAAQRRLVEALTGDWQDSMIQRADGSFVGIDSHYGTGPKLDWIIAGGESGPKGRPMHPDWARSLRDQCAEAGVPFLFKQWGEWAPAADGERCVDLDGRNMANLEPNGTNGIGTVRIAKLGKKVSGRLLDGVTQDGFPA